MVSSKNSSKNTGPSESAKRLKSLVDKRTQELKESNKKLRKAQAELRKVREELRYIDVKKNQFMSITSHELQTPMTSIRGFSQLLNKEEVFKNTKRRKRYLKIIQGESRRLSKLVREMLDLSRIDLGTLKFHVSTFDPVELIQDIKLQMDRIAKEKGILIIVKTDKGLPEMTTDRERIKQIIMNLVSNSIKYTSKGSVTIEAKKDGDFIQFSVADTGIGIAKKEYNKIFERFYQANYSYDRTTTGAGLGLSICKEFTELMGGKIWLNSKVGEGTVFFFTTPIKFTTSKLESPIRNKSKQSKKSKKSKKRKKLKSRRSKRKR